MADPTEGSIVIRTAETRGVWFTFGIQTQGQYVSPTRVLMDFLDRTPKCLKVLDEIGKKLGLRDFRTASLLTPMLAATLDEMGSSIGRSKEFGVEAQMPGKSFFEYFTEVGNRRGIILAGVTTYGPDGPVVWMSHVGMKGEPPSRNSKGYKPGEAVFHEAVHAYLFAVGLNSHENIVNTLGIDLLDWNYRTAEGSDARKAEENFRASESFQAWIARGCRNAPRGR